MELELVLSRRDNRAFLLFLVTRLVRVAEDNELGQVAVRFAEVATPLIAQLNLISIADASCFTIRTDLRLCCRQMLTGRWLCQCTDTCNQRQSLVERRLRILFRLLTVPLVPVVRAWSRLVQHATRKLNLPLFRSLACFL